MKSQGYLTWVDGHRDALPDLASDLATAEGGTDKTNPSSLYCTLLKRVRDTAGFHVQRGLVHDILRMIKDLPVKAANVTGPEQAVLSMPVVEFLMAFLIWSDGRDENELAATMGAAVALQSALRNVAHDLYFLRVRFATELPRG